MSRLIELKERYKLLETEWLEMSEEVRMLGQELDDLQDEIDELEEGSKDA